MATCAAVISFQVVASFSNPAPANIGISSWLSVWVHAYVNKKFLYERWFSSKPLEKGGKGKKAGIANSHITFSSFAFELAKIVWNGEINLFDAIFCNWDSLCESFNKLIKWKFLSNVSIVFENENFKASDQSGKRLLGFAGFNFKLRSKLWLSGVSGISWDRWGIRKFFAFNIRGASVYTLTPTDLFLCLALGLCGLELVQASYNKEIGTILTLYDSYLKSRIILKFVFYSCSISHRSKTIKADVKIELKHTLLFLLPIC